MESRELMLALRDVVAATERERLWMAREVLNIGLNEMLACAHFANSGHDRSHTQ